MDVTIFDVAHRAGVSHSTVSIVYNGGPLAKRISAATTARVEQAIRDLNYHPNVVRGRSPRSGSSLSAWASTCRRVPGLFTSNC